jgi:hypothetical protein
VSVEAAQAGDHHFLPQGLLKVWPSKPG